MRIRFQLKRWNPSIYGTSIQITSKDKDLTLSGAKLIRVVIHNRNLGVCIYNSYIYHLESINLKQISRNSFEINFETFSHETGIRRYQNFAKVKLQRFAIS